MRRRKKMKDMEKLLNEARDLARNEDITYLSLAVTDKGIMFMSHGAKTDLLGYMEVIKHKLIDIALKNYTGEEI